MNITTTGRFKDNNNYKTLARMSAECTSFLIDLSDQLIENGNVAKIVPYLEYTLFDKCQRRRKTDWVNFYLVNYKDTNNLMSLENIYQVLDFVAPIMTDDVFKTIQLLTSINAEDRINDQGTTSIDQALLLSTLEIKNKFAKKKMLRQIVCFSDDLMSLNLSDEEIDEILQEYPGRFILIDCRNTAQIQKDEDNEISTKSAWYKLVNKCPNSFIVKIDSLLLDIMSPKAAVVKPVRVFAGELRLGADIQHIIKGNNKNVNDSNDKDSDYLCISVEGYPATKSVSSLSRKQYIKEASIEDKDKIKYIAPSSVIAYEIHESTKQKKELNSESDDETDFTAISVSKESITKAYRYGTDYVVLPPVLADDLVYKTVQGIDIRGFMDRDELPRYYLCSESTFIFADTRIGSRSDKEMFSALVDVMLQNKKIAICRYVSKKLADVQMCAMVPIWISTKNLHLSDESGESYVKCLVLNRLPFAEDERVSDFPKLISRKTTSGKLIEEEPEKQKEIDELMSSFIDSMDTDDMPCVPDELYFKHISETGRDTILPLPNPTNEGYNMDEVDPLRMLAIAPHRQQQVLLEYIHQIIIEEKSEFYPPDLPDTIKDKITPYVKTPMDLEKLISLLELKQVAPKNYTGDKFNKYAASNLIATKEGPPLEELLALGKRDPIKDSQVKPE